MAEEEKEAALKPRERCPVCGGDNLDTTCNDRRPDVMAEKVFCMDCGKGWREVYDLKLVEIIEEEDLYKEDSNA